MKSGMHFHKIHKFLESYTSTYLKQLFPIRTLSPPSTLAFPCFDGLYLPKQESEFVHQVLDELEAYQEKNNPKSVLLFPPLPSRLRYLIHTTIEEVPELTTFSVGDSWCRRVVVCYSELRGELEVDSDLESNNSLYEEPASCRGKTEANVKSKASRRERRAPKRPDKTLYMPRAARERQSLQNPQGATAELQSPYTAPWNRSSIGSVDSASRPDTTETTKDSLKQERNPPLAHSIQELSADSVTQGPREENSITLANGTHDLEQTLSCFADLTVREDEKEDLPDGLTDDPSKDTDDVSGEIRPHLKEAVAFSIELVHNDYSIYENVCFNSEDFGHVIEIYDFPAIFKTDDLLDAFTEYSEGGMKITWVDNTHALGVFASESAALHALSIHHPLLRARPLAKGSKIAKGKAFRRAEFIQPVKERPRTDCAVARRMVTRALGIRGRGRRQLY